MKTHELVLSCLAHRDGDVWVVMCLDYCLAAQAGSFDDARHKLELQINEYLHDALAGEDREHARHFLKRRRAPLSLWARFYTLRFVGRLRRLNDNLARRKEASFDLPMPLAPVTC